MEVDGLESTEGHASIQVVGIFSVIAGCVVPIPHAVVADFYLTNLALFELERGRTSARCVSVALSDDVDSVDDASARCLRGVSGNDLGAVEPKFRHFQILTQCKRLRLHLSLRVDLCARSSKLSGDECSELCTLFEDAHGIGNEATGKSDETRGGVVVNPRELVVETGDYLID